MTTSLFMLYVVNKPLLPSSMINEILVFYQVSPQISATTLKQVDVLFIFRCPRLLLFSQGHWYSLLKYTLPCSIDTQRSSMGPYHLKAYPPPRLSDQIFSFKYKTDSFRMQFASLSWTGLITGLYNLIELLASC